MWTEKQREDAIKYCFNDTESINNVFSDQSQTISGNNDLHEIESESDSETDEPTYHIDGIQGKRFNTETRKVEYLVKFTGYDE